MVWLIKRPYQFIPVIDTRIQHGLSEMNRGSRAAGAVADGVASDLGGLPERAGLMTSRSFFVQHARPA